MEAECHYAAMSDGEGRSLDSRTTQYYADAKVLPALNDQDMIRTGEDGGDWYAMVADGHGNGRVIDMLRRMTDWPSICRGDRPIAEVQRRVAALAPTFRDGSTLAFARISSGAFQASWLGDSRIALFKDGKLAWQSQDHSTRNSEEVQRAIRAGCRRRAGQSYALRVLSPSTITMEANPILELGSRPGGPSSEVDATNITRCLGHDHGEGPRLPQDPGLWTCQLEAGADYKVVLGSDGLWDMMCDDDARLLGDSAWSAARLADLARERWLQTWTYYHPGSTEGRVSISQEKMTSSDIDDIAVAVWCGRASRA